MATPSMQPIGERSQQWTQRRREVASDPDNDELRLKYAADWEAQGLDPRRSWLIRVQVRLAQLPEGMDHPEWSRLSLEAHRLLIESAEEWTPSWFDEAGVSDPEFHRGFLESVTVPASALLQPRWREKLFAEDPIRHINMVGIQQESDFEMIVRTPEMRDVLSLSADGQGLTDQCMRILANQSNLRNLRWLSVAWNRIDETGVRAIAEAYGGLLKNLQYAEFRGNPADPAEQFEEDLGIVVGRIRPQLAADLESAFGPLPWLHREVIAGQVLIPGRFETRSRSVSVTT